MRNKLALSLLVLGQVCHAATNSNWVQSAAWSPDESSTVKKSSLKHANRIAEITPFSPGSHNVAVDLGQVFLMGDLTRYSDSIGLQVHYSYGVSDLFGFDGSIGYSEHGDGKFSMTSVLAGMRMNLSWYDKVIPYGLFGLGFYRPNFKDATAAQVAGASTSTDSGGVSALLFGIHLGPGIDLQISRNLFFGAALTFHSVFGASKALTNGSNLNLGGTYTSFFLHAGFTF